MPTEIEILSELNVIFRNIFGQKDLIVTANTTAKDVSGWDSFKQIEIIMTVSQHYRIKFHTRDLDSLGNVGDLIKIVHSKLNK